MMAAIDLISGGAISSAAQLAAFHTSRKQVYEIVARLIGGRPNPEMLATWRTEISSIPLGESSRAHRQLKQVLAQVDVEQLDAEHTRLFRGSDRLVDLRCAAPDTEIRQAGYAAALQPTGQMRDAELRAMASLAERTAWAIRCGDFAQATALVDLQARWIHAEGRNCLSALGSELEAAKSPIYTEVGRALKYQLEDDAVSLALPAVP